MDGWIGRVVAAALALAVSGVLGGIVVYGQQQGIQERVNTNEKNTKTANDLATVNALAVSRITQWIEIDRDRTEREHRENVTQHEKILDRLDEIQEAR